MWSGNWSDARPGDKFDGYLRMAYGITRAQYEEMLRRQGGRCALCGRKPRREGNRLHVDHAHGSGRIRGLLCWACNAYISIVDRLGWAKVRRYLNGCAARSRKRSMTKWKRGTVVMRGAR
jgi:hypothetical protein